MFSSQQHTHQFSPQRRQVLGGANKRLGTKRSDLGSQESASVGPQKLFADLKQQTSATKKTSTSSTKAGSRAFGEKTSNQSPQRVFDRQHGPSGSDVPIKPQASLKGKQAAGKQQLVSPSKVEKKAAESIFPASSSPKKRSQKQKEEKGDGLTNEDRESLTSPTMGATLLTPQLSQMELSAPEFVTPVANIGHAGAMRQRMGDLLDAMAQQQDGSVLQNGDGDVSMHVNGATEEELYPEIEYMPPRVEVPYDFPAELDGLPRGAEMGALVSRPPKMGFYKATRPASIEEQRLETLSGIPERLSTDNESDMTVTLSSKLDDGDLWPDVPPTERKGEMALKPASVQVSKTAAPAKRQPVSSTSSIRKSAQVPGTSVPRARAVVSDPSKVRTTTNASRTGASMSGKSSQPSRPTTTLAGTKAKKPFLSVKSSNANIVRKPAGMASAYGDFDNDKMAKTVEVKLKALEVDAAVEGFTL